MPTAQENTSMPTNHDANRKNTGAAKSQAKDTVPSKPDDTANTTSPQNVSRDSAVTDDAPSDSIEGKPQPPMQIFRPDVAIAEIKRGERRPVDQSKVTELVESIREIGLQQPIGLTANLDLIYGLHRIEAYEALGNATIPAIVHHGLDVLHVELAEIDENLIRSGLSDLEESEALERRKQIYEELHPEAKHGGNRRSGSAKSSRQNGGLKSFAANTAAKTGRSDRSIQRALARAKHIPRDLRQRLKGTPLEKKASDLDAIGRLPEKEQRAVVEQAATGAKSLRDAVMAISEPWSPHLCAVVIDKTVLKGLRETLNLSPAEMGKEIQQLAKLPANKQQAVAAFLTSGQATTLEQALAKGCQTAPARTSSTGKKSVTSNREVAVNNGETLPSPRVGGQDRDVQVRNMVGELRLVRPTPDTPADAVSLSQVQAVTAKLERHDPAGCVRRWLADGQPHSGKELRNLDADVALDAYVYPINSRKEQEVRRTKSSDSSTNVVGQAKAIFRIALNVMVYERLVVQQGEDGSAIYQLVHRP